MLVVLDIICILGAFFVGLWLRFDFRLAEVPTNYLFGFLKFVAAWCPIALVVFGVFRLYHSIWHFASVDELLRIIGAYLVLGMGTLV